MTILQDIRFKFPICCYSVNIGLKYLEETIIDQFKVDMNPNYQRDYVWNIEQKQKFVGSLLENHKAIPPIWLNFVSKDFEDSHSEIVDGKQRINACLEWLNGSFDAICPCGIKIHYNDLDEVDIRGLSTYYNLVWNFVRLNKKEVMDFYVRLNSGGTVHSDSELQKVRKLIEELENDD